MLGEQAPRRSCRPAAVTAYSRRQDQIDAAGPDGAVRGLAYCRTLSDMTDEWVVDVFDQAIAEHRRRQGAGRAARRRRLRAGRTGAVQRPRHGARARRQGRELRSKVTPLASALWYPLWDAGVKLGHAVRIVERPDRDLAGTTSTPPRRCSRARPLAGDDELARQAMAAGLEVWRRRAAQSGGAPRTWCVARQARGERGRVPARTRSQGRPRRSARRPDRCGGPRSAGLIVRAADEADLARLLRRPRCAPGSRSTSRPSGPAMSLRLEDQDAAAARGRLEPTPTTLMASVAAAARTVGVDRRRDLAIARSARTNVPPNRAVGAGHHRCSTARSSCADGAHPADDQALVLTRGRRRRRASTSASDGSPSTGSSRTSRAGRATGPSAPDRSSWLCCSKDIGRSPALEALDQRELFGRLLPEWEPGPVEAAAQRLPPLHRRSPPLGDGRQRRRARADRVEPARPARARRAAPRHRQGVPGRSHRGRHGARARDRPRGSGSGRATSTRWWRWSSTTCCCPMSRCAATSPTRPRSSKVADAVETVERLELLACAHRRRLDGHRPVGVGLVEGGARRRPRRPACVTCSAAASHRGDLAAVPRCRDAAHRWRTATVDVRRERRP